MICPACGDEFTPRSKSNIYCGNDACKLARSRKTSREAMRRKRGTAPSAVRGSRPYTVAPRVCEDCGKRVYGKGNVVCRQCGGLRTKAREDERRAAMAAKREKKRAAKAEVVHGREGPLEHYMLADVALWT